jgi:hypothetical protein
MSWTHGWWTRISSPIDVGRDSLARLVGRVGGGQPVRERRRCAPPRHRADASPHHRREPRRQAGAHSGHAALVADLGIDPLDVLDVMTRVENVVGIAYPEGEIDALRTFEDLVLVTRALLSVRLAAEQPAPAHVQGRLQIRSAGGATLDRVVALTPYDCETIADDLALSQGNDDREITVTGGVPSAALASLDAALLSSRLGGRRTTVRRLASARTAEGTRQPAEERTPATNAAALRVARHAVDLLECLSNERGMAALYLASSGALYAPEIQAARAQTNRRIAAFRTIVQTYSPLLGSALRARLNAAIARLGDLGAIRARRGRADAPGHRDPGRVPRRRPRARALRVDARARRARPRAGPAADVPLGARRGDGGRRHRARDDRLRARARRASRRPTAPTSPR